MPSVSVLCLCAALLYHKYPAMAHFAPPHARGLIHLPFAHGDCAHYAPLLHRHAPIHQIIPPGRLPLYPSHALIGGVDPKSGCAPTLRAPHAFHAAIYCSLYLQCCAACAVLQYPFAPLGDTNTAGAIIPAAHPYHSMPAYYATTVLDG